MFDLFVVVVCLTINAVFSAFEMAFVTIDKDDIDELDDSQKILKQRLLRFKNFPERTLSVIQIGITMVGAVAAAVGGAGAVETLEPYLVNEYGLSDSIAEAVSVVTIIVPLTYFSVVFGELVPKTVALRHPHEVLRFGTLIIHYIDKFLSPIVTFLERSTGLILKLLGLNKEEEEEIPEYVEIGSLPQYHRHFVQNLVSLKSKRIGTMLIPWEKVIYLDFAETDETVKAKIRESHRSRFPVIDGEVLVGLFHVKEWNEFINGVVVPWQSILAPALTVKQNEYVLDVFLKMQEANYHLAVVRGSQEEFVGIVTIEDILEQIVGKIKDDLERNRISRLLSHRAKITFKK
jgi:putative hemolysin